MGVAVFMILVLPQLMLVKAGDDKVRTTAFGWYGSKAPDYGPNQVRGVGQQSLLLRNTDEISFANGLVTKLLSSWFEDNSPDMEPFQVQHSSKWHMTDLTIRLEKTTVYVRCSDSLCTGGSLLAFTRIQESLYSNGTQLVPLFLMQQLENTTDTAHEVALVSGTVLPGNLPHETVKNVSALGDDTVIIPVQQAPKECRAGAVIAVAGVSALAYGQADLLCSHDITGNNTRLMVNTYFGDDIGGGDIWIPWHHSTKECPADMYFLHNRDRYSVSLLRGLQGGTINVTYVSGRSCNGTFNIFVHAVYARCLMQMDDTLSDENKMKETLLVCVKLLCGIQPEEDIQPEEFNVIWIVQQYMVEGSGQQTPYIVRTLGDPGPFREAQGLCFGQWNLDILSVLETTSCGVDTEKSTNSWAGRCQERSRLVKSIFRASAAEMSRQSEDAVIAFDDVYGSRTPQGTIFLALVSAVLGSVASAGSLLPVTAQFANAAFKKMLPSQQGGRLWPFLSVTILVVLVGTVSSTAPLLSVIYNDARRVFAKDLYALQAGVVFADTSNYNIIGHDFIRVKAEVNPTILVLELLAFVSVFLLTVVYVVTTLRSIVKRASTWSDELDGIPTSDRVVVLLFSNPAIEAAGGWRDGWRDK